VGLEVPHAHVHLIPMNKTEDMNLLNPKLSLSKEEMQEVQQRILESL
jgi:histidine triad (HIT) family protein